MWAALTLGGEVTQNHDDEGEWPDTDIVTTGDTDIASAHCTMGQAIGHAEIGQNGPFQDSCIPM